MTGSAGACDLCPASSYCGNVYAVLSLLGREEHNWTDQQLKAKYEALRAELRRARWDFPHAHSGCSLADAPAQVRRLADELIALWRDAQAAAAAVNLYDEEVNFE